VKKMKNTVIKLETLTCPSCIRRIEGMVAKQIGVESVEVKFNASKVEIRHDESVISAEELSKAISILGYKVLEVK
jgi:copper chaperone CopZ